MRKITTALCSLALSAAAISAQNKYMVEVLHDKKVIYVENFGLSEGSPAFSILMMIPELVGRDNESLFENYDIQFGGKSIGSGRDAILYNTTVGEIKKIEISANPTVSQQKNGQCGTINFVPKDISEGFSGVAMLEGETTFDVMPKLLLNYKKDKLELRGNVNMEYYRPFMVKEYTLRGSQDRSMITETDSTSVRYFQQTARVDLRYRISDRDEFKAWIMESWYRDTQTINESLAAFMDMASTTGEGWYFKKETSNTSNVSKQNLTVSAIGEYKHTFTKGASFITSLNYSLDKFNSGADFNIPNTLVFEGKFDNIKLLDKAGHNVFMKAGLNADYGTASASAGTKRLVSTLSAFTEFKYVNKCITANVGVRYMYHDRNFVSNSIPASRSNDDDVTASAGVVWQIKPHHALKLDFSRNLIRPSDEMLYPGIIPASRTIGDPSLRNTYIHSVNLGYITDWSNSDGHRLTFNITTGYDRTDGIIEKVMTSQGDINDIYSTFRNSGISNILKDNLSLIYNKDIFTMSFSGNFFYNLQFAGASDRYHGYYNLNFTPILSLPYDWTISGHVIYNSAVVSNDAILGDRLNASATVAKTFGNWRFELYLGDIFGWRTTDMEYIGKTIIESAEYNTFSRYVGLTIGCRF